MTRFYKHLTLEDRVQIAIFLKEGYSKRAIARKINVPVTRITREITRNIGSNGVYHYDEAHKKSLDRRYKPTPKRKMRH